MWELGGAVASWLVRSSPDQVVRVRALTGDIVFFMITAEIHVRSLVNFYCPYADRHMNLKFMRHVSERERAIRQFVIVKTN